MASSNLSPATLNTKASQETFISLLQLDPQPMADDEDKPLPALPEEGSALSTSSSDSWTNVMADSAATVRPGDGDSASQQPPEPPAVPKVTANPLGLSRSPIYYLSRIQRFSSYTFTLFATLHLTTTSLVPLTQYVLVGPSATRLATAVAASDGALLAAREIYQAPYTEPFLVGLPMLAHVASGVAMRLLRWRQNLRRYGGATPGMRALARKRDHEDPSGTSKEQERRIQSAWPRVTYVALSGHVLFPLVAIHMFVNRILPLRHPAAGDSSAIALAYVSHGFARHGRPGGRLSWLLGPAVWAFYGALVVLGAGHIVWGWARWLGVESAVLGTGPAGILRLGWRRTATDSTELAAGPAGRAQFDPETRRRRRRSWWSVQAVAVATAVAWAAGGLGVVARAGAAPGWIGKLYDALYDSVGL